MDKFYTKSHIAEKCITHLKDFYDLTDFNSIIEPSCGSGAFLKHLPDNKTIGIDTKPELDFPYNNILTMDYFNYWPEQSNNLYNTFLKLNKRESILVIGNPPFGRSNKLAVDFFNHSAIFAKTIAMILPMTFKRISVQNRLHINYHLIDQFDIPIGSFIPETMKAKCVWQVWEFRSMERDIIKLDSHHPDFTFVNIDKADIAIKAYGGTGDCGQILKPPFPLDMNPKAYHYLKITNDQAHTIFPVLDYYPLAGNTVRQDSIGQKELILLYKQKT